MAHELSFLAKILDGFDAVDRYEAFCQIFRDMLWKGFRREDERSFDQFWSFMSVVAGIAGYEIEDALLSDISSIDTVYPITIALEREGQVQQTAILTNPPSVCRFSGLVPGRYILRLSTGRVLWSDTLEKEDIEWAAAYPGRPLDLAADTDAIGASPTYEIPLLDGEIVIGIFPGLETGTLAVDLRR